MGRRRRAWLVGGDGRRAGRRGYYVAWHEWDNHGRRLCRMRQFDSRRLAGLYVQRYNAARELQMAGELVHISIEDASAEFVRGCAALADATRDGYESAVALLEAHGATHLDSVDGVLIDRLIAARSREVSAASVARDLRSLTRFFNWAIARGYLERNPVKLATSRPKAKHARARPRVNDAQLTALVKSLDTPDRRLAVWLGMTTGLDRGVIEGLRADQVDIEDGIIRTRRRKTGKVGAAPIHPALLSELARLVRGAVSGRPLLRGLSRQARDEDWWCRARDAAGLPTLLFRDLRAVASSRLLRAGVALPDVQRLLGHASSATTADHYLTPSPAAAAVLASLPLPGHPNSEGSKTG